MTEFEWKKRRQFLLKQAAELLKQAALRKQAEELIK